MATPEKEEAVREIRDKLSQAKVAVLTEFRGLNVHDLAELRAKLRAAGVEYKVVKNTLTKRAVDELGLEELDPYLEGPTAIAFGYDDEIAPAKVLADFAKAHADLRMKAGMLQGSVLDAERVRALAKIPPREQLVAQLLGTLQSPVAGLARVLNGPAAGLARVLNQVAQQKA
ncbi:MAG: 50S ribosomal protein L10 [Actinobacteria bacterium]|nr:MAG: 50S ribosomal protein L10 [Actinomycetota bacterium]